MIPVRLGAAAVITGASLTELTMIVAVLDCVENAVVPPVVAALAVVPCVPVD